jgi:hypothetical protein
MLKPLSAGKIGHLVGAMRELFDAAALERGWHYYHRGHVLNLFPAGNDVYATVRGGNVYRVRLDLENAERSECSCPIDGYCKHMAAVCFQVYASHGRPELLLAELIHRAESRSKRLEALKTRVKKNAEAAPVPEPGSAPLQWHQYFDRQFYGYSVTHPHAVEDFYAIAQEKLHRLCEGWADHDQALFRAHVLLFVLRKLDQFHTHNATTYFSYYLETGCRKVAALAMEQLEQTLAEMDARGLRLMKPSDLDETAEIVGRLAFRDNGRGTDGIDIFRLVWSGLLNDPERIRRESARLREQLAAEDAATYRGHMLRLALAHFDVLAQRDDPLLSLSEQPPLNDIALYLWYLREFRRAGQWDRLGVWLRRLVPLLRQAKEEHFRTVCGYWVEMAGRQSSDEEWVRAMESLLPRSFRDYSDHLMKTGRYRQWVDLQLAHRMMPAHLRSDELAQVEAHDPELLLPLYHQSAERYILEKNRNSYKAAVRLLRRLKSLYGKLGQEERWNEFIHRFVGKYGRLRALQEELRKGKLMP